MSDVCLILEGTYPYVAGGVSSWVYSLIKGMPDIDFSIVYLGAHRGMSKKMHYEIPSNVVDFREYYLFDYRIQPEKKRAIPKQDIELLAKCLKQIRKGEPGSFEEIIRMIGNKETRTIGLHDLVHSHEVWQLIEELYRLEEEDMPFIDYFWTWRFLHLPFFSILRLDPPEAKLYHAVSTGYAGVVAAMCKLLKKRPFVLTEHGIYTRERKIEIARADWIYSEDAAESIVLEGKDFFKDWWTNLFSYFSRIAYQHADEIITLYERNREVQIEEGADPKKTRIIPNGVVMIEAEPKPQRSSKTLRVGFVGRVVPIKDVKTFIMACQKIHDQIPDCEVFILGPTDEDEDYYQQCVMLADMQSLSSVVQFKGKVNVKDYYPQLDLIVLTSISEAQPLVILEAFAYRIPVVASDVGACSELIYGRTPDDQLMGAGGIVTPICDSDATAEAVIKILKDPAGRKRMGQVGYERTKKYYQMDDLLANYQTLYAQHTEAL